MNEKYLIIKLAIEKGKLLQALFPEIKDFYLARIRFNGEDFPLHFSIKDIATFIWHSQRLREKLNIGSFSLLENTIRYALLGNNKGGLGEVYEGLLGEEEYKRVSSENRINSGEETYEKSLSQRKGALFQTREQLSAAAKKAVIARGEKPWTEEEKRRAYSLRKEGYSAREIGDYLERTRYSVLEMFRRDRKKYK